MKLTEALPNEVKGMVEFNSHLVNMLLKIRNEAYHSKYCQMIINYVPDEYLFEALAVAPFLLEDYFEFIKFTGGITYGGKKNVVIPKAISFMAFLSSSVDFEYEKIRDLKEDTKDDLLMSFPDFSSSELIKVIEEIRDKIELKQGIRYAKSMYKSTGNLIYAVAMYLAAFVVANEGEYTAVDVARYIFDGVDSKVSFYVR